jgi:hypothetical protein
MGKLKQQHKNAVIASIRNAFEDVRLGDGVSLHQARALDDWEPAARALTARENDREMNWYDLAEEKLRHFSDVFPFLDLRGWSFYIPAFMIWILKHEDDTAGDDRGLDYSAVFSLTERDSGSELLTVSQREAVIAFLQHLARYSSSWRDEARAALNTIWVTK